MRRLQGADIPVTMQRNLIPVVEARSPYRAIVEPESGHADNMQLGMCGSA